MSENPYVSPVHESISERPRSNFGGFLWKSLLVAGILFVAVALLLPATRSARPAARRSQCSNNLKQIALALHNYHDAYGSLPPAYTVDADGNRLHSWRTLILPFVENEPLYDSIDFSKPWNDQANARAYETEIPIYRCPAAIVPAHHTTYLVIVAPESCFPPDRTIHFSDVRDDPSNTVMVIEVDDKHAVHWMEPRDVDPSYFIDIGLTAKSPHTSGFNVVIADGSIRFLWHETPVATRRSMITISGHDKPLDDAE